MSLLKRLEQGKESGPDRAEASSGGSSGGGQRLSNLQARRSAPPGGGGRDTYMDLKTRVQNRLLAEMDPGMDISKTAEVRKTIQGLYEQILVEDSIVLSRQAASPDERNPAPKPY